MNLWVMLVGKWKGLVVCPPRLGRSSSAGVTALDRSVRPERTHTQIYSVAFIYTIVAVTPILVAFCALLYYHIGCSAGWSFFSVPVCSAKALVTSSRRQCSQAYSMKNSVSTWLLMFYGTSNWKASLQLCVPNMWKTQKMKHSGNTQTDMGIVNVTWNWRTSFGVEDQGLNVKCPSEHAVWTYKSFIATLLPSTLSSPFLHIPSFPIPSHSSHFPEPALHFFPTLWLDKIGPTVP